MAKNKSLYIDAVGYTFASLLGAFFTFLLQVVLARLLPVSDYGLYNSYAVLLFLLLIMTDPIQLIVIKSINKSQEIPNLRSFILANIRHFAPFVIATTLLLYFLTPVISDFYHHDTFIPILIISAIYLVNIILQILFGIFNGIKNVVLFSISTIILNLSKFFFAAVFAYFGLGIEAILSSMFISTLLSTIFLLSFLPASDHSKNKIKLEKINYSYFLLIFSFTFIVTSDIILARHFLPPHIAGLYTGLSTMGKILYFASASATRIFFPHMVSTSRNKKSGLILIVKNLFFSSLIAFPILLLFYLVPEKIILLILGAPYVDISPYLFWMGLIMYFYAVSNILLHQQVASKKSKIVYFCLFFNLLQWGLVYFLPKSITSLMITYACVVAGLIIFQLLSLYYIFNVFSNTSNQNDDSA